MAEDLTTFKQDVKKLEELSPSERYQEIKRKAQRGSLKYWPKRILQYISGIHRIHHITYGYGYLFWGVLMRFPKRSYRTYVVLKYPVLWKCKDDGYHDCTKTGIY